jgi:hypothetical protein
MVHALGEIHRVLVPDGVLIDLRPLCDRWIIEVFSARETRQTGHVTDLPLGLEDDAASNRAMRNAEAQGWFAREREERSSHSIMSGIPPATWKNGSTRNGRTSSVSTRRPRRATRSAWALGDADSRVRVRAKMLITRWKKL